MSIAEAQSEMRLAYYSGGTGILASALAWWAAGGAAIFGTGQNAVWTLLIGGALIYPVSLVICKLLGASVSHPKSNPLGQLAGASTFWLIFCLPLAYVLSLQHPNWFFWAMLLIIGGRYLVFATIYGMRLYWALGLVLAASGFALAVTSAPAHLSAIAGASVETVFALVCLAQHRRWLRSDNSPSRDSTGDVA